MDDPLVPTNNNNSQPISTGGFSPEIAPAPVASQESGGGSKESGYENIQQIERKAEEIEHKEVAKPTPPPQQQQKPQPPKPISIEKKEGKGPKFRYFGYKPPQALVSNVSKLRAQANRGHKNDSKTWLLFFLDRLAKKEDK